MRWRVFAAMCCVVMAGGCATVRLTLPAPISSGPGCSSFAGTFLAGFGRADITPPPGLGLSGYGPEGRRASGHRHRLYARAMVLEDEDGARIALVVADLPLASAILQRESAALLPPALCLGADRMILVATHTHAGPGHFMMAGLINRGASSVRGYDQNVVDFLAERIASAVEQAVGDLSPALAGWASAEVWGLTRNRSLVPFLQNEPPAFLPDPPTEVDGRPLRPEQVAVDPTMTMLRIDRIVTTASGAADTVPAGAFSLFAMHQTGNPSANDLYDADIFAWAERGLERHIDTRAGRERPEGPPNASALFALGAAGDISPDWPDARVCPIPRAERIRTAPGPRGPQPPVVWSLGRPDRLASCIAAGRAYIDEAGPKLAERAIDLFDSMDGRLEPSFEIARAFETVPLRGPNRPPQLCEEPRAGTPTVGGTEDGNTRFYRWSILGLIPSGFEEGGSGAWGRPRGCHGHKRVVGGFLQGPVTGDFGLPHVAQLSVVRIGPRLIGAVPWEVTTTAGQRITRSMDAASRTVESALSDALLITVSNGYLQYLTTEEEYSAQHYEGGSNLYGPRTAEFLTDRMASLAASAVSDSPTVFVGSIEAEPGKQTDIFPRPDKKAPPSRAFAAVERSGDTIRVRWTDAYPGDLLPADGPILYIERGSNAAAEFVTWDDSAALEVRGVRPAGGNDYVWEVTWTGCEPGVDHRFVLTPRRWESRNLGATAPLPRVIGPWFACE